MLFLAAASAGAEVPPAERPRSVVLTVTGPAADARALRASARELLARLGVQLAPGPGGDGALARLSVDLNAEPCVLTVSEATAQPAFSRHVQRGETAALTVEIIAHMLQSAVEELLERDRAAASARAEAPVPEPKPVSPPPEAEPGSGEEAPPALRPDGLGVELGAQATGRSFNSGAWAVFGAGATTVLRFPAQGSWAPQLALSVGWSGPFDVAAGVVTTTTQTVSVRLLAGARVALGSRLALDVGLGGGADVFASSSHSALPEGQYVPQIVAASPMLGAMAVMRWRVAPLADVCVSLAGDVDLTPHRYVSLATGASVVLFQHWTLRPALALGFSFDLWGAR